MSLSIGQLKEVAHGVIRNQKLLNALVSEARASFGPVISSDTTLIRACSEILDRSDLMEARGTDGNIRFRTSTLKKLLETRVPIARLLATRFLPLNLIKDLAFDKDPDVRYEACRRLPATLVNEVSGIYPSDYGVKMLLEKKEKEVKDQHLHMYDKERLGKAANPERQADFSDLWYNTLAYKAVQEYGGNIEGQWEEPFVQRYCASYKATNGVELDSEKLYKSIMNALEKRADDAMTQGELKRLEKLHRMRESKEATPISLDERLAEALASPDRLNAIGQLFLVREAAIPSGLRKYTVTSGVFHVPMKATVPGGKLTYAVERALDAYVNAWNSRQEMLGENVKLSWSPDPGSLKNVCFHVVVK